MNKREWRALNIVLKLRYSRTQLDSNNCNTPLRRTLMIIRDLITTQLPC